MPGSISSPENTDEADVSLFDRQSLRLGVAGRMVARASYDALVLRGTTGQLLGLPVDDAVALGRGVGARCPLPEHDPQARRLVAQYVVAERVDLSPVEPGRAGAQHRGANGAGADPQALRHLAVGPPQAPLLSQDLSCLAHGQSLGGHPSPFRGAGGPADGPASLRFGQRPDHDPPIPVITMPIFLITIDRSW